MKRRKALMKTVKSFEYFIEFENLFTNEMEPKYAHLLQIMSTTSLQIWNVRII